MIHVTVKNGMTLAYTLAFVNACLGAFESFYVHLNHAQQASLTTLVNASVLLIARVMTMKETTPDGGTVAVKHVPVVVETPPGGGEPTVTPVIGDPAPVVGVTQ